jgi:hypothetical protein
MCCESISQRGLEDRSDDAVDDLDGGRSLRLAQFGSPVLDFARSYGGEAPVAKVGIDVAAEVGLDVRAGRGAVHLRLPPVLRELSESRGIAGIDVIATYYVGHDTREEALSVDSSGAANHARTSRGSYRT